MTVLMLVGAVLVLGLRVQAPLLVGLLALGAGAIRLIRDLGQRRLRRERDRLLSELDGER